MFTQEVERDRHSQPETQQRQEGEEGDRSGRPVEPENQIQTENYSEYDSRQQESRGRETQFPFHTSECKVYYSSNSPKARPSIVYMPAISNVVVL